MKTYNIWILLCLILSYKTKVVNIKYLKFQRKCINHCYNYESHYKLKNIYIHAVMLLKRSKKIMFKNSNTSKQGAVL